jgi:hypothetical protein
MWHAHDAKAEACPPGLASNSASVTSGGIACERCTARSRGTAPVGLLPLTLAYFGLAMKGNLSRSAMGVRECGWWWWGDLCWETRACAFARAGVPVRHCYCSCSFPSSAGGSPSLSCRHCVSLFLSIMCSRVNLILQVPLDLRPLPAAAPTLPGRAQLRCRRISLPNLGAAMFPADLHAMRAPCAVGKHGPVHLAGDIGAWDRNQAPLASSSNGRVLFFSCWPRGSSNIYPRSITLVPVRCVPQLRRRVH